MRIRSLRHQTTLTLLLTALLAVGGSAAIWISLAVSRFEERAETMRRDYIASQKATVKSRTLETLGYINFKKAQAEKRLKTAIKGRTQEAWQTANYIYQTHAKTKTKAEIGRLIHDALYSVSWDDGKGYYFAEDMQGNEIINRNNPELVGTNLMDLQDSKGVYLMRRILEVAQNQGEGFCSYHWNKPGQPGVLMPKYSYVKYFKPLDWVIGTGKYLEAEEKLIQGEVLKRLNGLNVGQAGYVFIVTYGGTMLTYPAPNVDVRGMNDANGQNIYDAIMKVVRKGGGFVDYVMVKLGQEKVRPKVSYCVGIDDWQWYIGFGVYTDEIEAVIAQRRDEMKQQLLGQLLSLGAFLALLLAFCLLLSRFLSRGISRNLETFLQFFRRASDEMKPIPLDRVSFTEFERLAGTANQMIEDARLAENEKAQLQDQLVRAQKMEAIGLMAGGVAHDLNNILSGLISIPELLLLRLDEDSPHRPHIQLMMESGERAAAVVSDLLTVGRGVITKKTVVDLNQEADRYLESLRTSILASRSSDLALRFTPSAAPLPVNISQVHLEKTLMNLVTNAAEELPGGGCITVGTERIELDAPQAGYQEVPPGTYARLSVADNGPGIPMEDLQRIFEPFYTKKVMGRSGTGLGLSIVWNAMLDHRGFIQVESSPTGTDFQLYFPLAQAPVAEAVSEETGEPPHGTGQLILIVDDEEVQRKTAGELLTSLGYTTHAVSSGEEALNYLSEQPADLVLLDMMLGRGLSGLETYQRIIEHQPDQRAIIVTGYARSRDVEAAIALGAHHCLHKPYRRAALAHSLQRAFEPH
ncbi:MAG: cache domain-containing protein [Planctomycetota bacterium]|jgi:signal transduction histidine kinase